MKVVVRLTDTELKEIFHSQAATRPTKQECLSEDVLRRAAAKELGRHEREQVASHLRMCSDCVRDYRIAHSVRDWAEQAAIPAGLLTPEAVFGQEQPQIKFSARGRSAGSPGGAGSGRFLRYALAASVLTVIALGTWIVLLQGSEARSIGRLNAQLAERDRAIVDLQRPVEDAPRSGAPNTSAQTGSGNEEGSQDAHIAELEKAVAELSRPQFNVPIVDVEPGPARGEPGGSITRIDVPKSVNGFTLILHTSAKPSNTAYTLEITDSGGKLIFRGRGIKNTPENGLTVALSHRLMPAGRYSIKLYPQQKAVTEPIEQYVVEVHYR